MSKSDSKIKITALHKMNLKPVLSGMMKTHRNLLIATVGLSALFLPHELALVQFLIVVVALIFASSALGFATEELSGYYSAAISGFLNATFGNLAELIIGFFVILQGHTELAKASLTGSILGNLLMLVGMGYLVASVSKKEIDLHEKQAETTSTMLLLSVLFLLFPSLLFIFHEETYIRPISLLVASGLLLIYILYLLFSFKTHKDWFAQEESHTPTLSKRASFAVMITSIVLLGVLSENVSHGIEEVAKVLHLNDLFLGAILLGFVGNVAEHLSVVTLARKGKHQFVLPVAIGSSLQIAMFVVPVLVFVSALTGNFMDLSFLPLEVFSVLAAVLLANEIAKDKKTNWFEAMQLLVLYGVVAVMFFFAK